MIEHVRGLGFGHMDCGCGSGPLPIRWGQVLGFLAGRKSVSAGDRLAAQLAVGRRSGRS